ncbi:unnamed protein product [Zymoseptoria tritici ST99CH_1A5]|uniref:Uncharacterized protein n=2 Tax=Zymoseptoria tritici TaxID=1047171 RepID=F9XIT9_ZYMTI|nr:uncharacterized protein MYCGRDRAFT_95755 [Zymoseptoria tritici IPO323]EGP84666.1 hypothetical protein MYCGRDRAFT_95755 [Zymoseptoria tritici IPO323]SMY27744.1 unnamed protein product [Zymoseptoria tritici ST99CH_1A5]
MNDRDEEPFNFDKAGESSVEGVIFRELLAFSRLDAPLPRLILPDMSCDEDFVKIGSSKKLGGDMADSHGSRLWASWKTGGEILPGRRQGRLLDARIDLHCQHDRPAKAEYHCQATIKAACKEALESTDNDISRRTQELVQVKLVQYLPLSANPNIGRPPIL